MAFEEGGRVLNIRMQVLEAAIRRAQRAVEATPEGHPSRVRQLILLGNHLNSRYGQTGNLEDLDAAIARTEEALQITTNDHPDRGGWLNNLGNRLMARYELTRNPQDLEEAIAQLEAAVQATPVGHPDRAGRMDNHKKLVAKRYEQTGLEDLPGAIGRLELGTAAVQDPSDQAGLWDDGWYSSSEHEIIGDPLGLDVEIARLEATLYAAREDHPGRPQWLSTLGLHLGSRYQQTGNLHDLEAAIARSESAVQATSEGHPAQWGRRSNLGMLLTWRHDCTGNIEDSDGAITQLEVAVRAAPQGHPDQAGLLNNLGGCLVGRYRRTGNRQDLEAAIARFEAAVPLTPECHPNRARLLNNLGSCIGSRYELTGNMKDLETAIDRAGVAVGESLEGHPERAEQLSSFGRFLYRRYELTGNPEDLETAIASLSSAVRETPGGHPNRAGWLGILGMLFGNRYERSGNVEDLEAAIARIEATLEATPEFHPDRAAWLCNLGNCLGRRYERTGNLQDLEAAIAHTEAAVQATPHGHYGRARLSNNLSNRLRSRYEETGNLQDLEAAIAQSEAVVQATPEGHPDRPTQLNNLGNCLTRRYERVGNPQDLEAAIMHSRAAVLATPVGHPDGAARFSSLATHLQVRFERTGDLQDLGEIIALSEAGVAAATEGHPDLSGWLSNVGGYLSKRYERTDNVQDLEAAIARFQSALQATSDDHPDRARQLINLGNGLGKRYEQTGNHEDLRAAVDALCASWNILTAPILTRLQAAYQAAAIMIFRPEVEDLPRACSLLYDAVHLLPLVTSRALEREDQQHILAQLTGLPSLAASVSLEEGGSPLGALQLLELGRSVTNGQLLDYRSDISDLKEKHPALAHDFDTLRQELDSPIPSQEPADLSMDQRLWAQQSNIRRRNRAAKNFDRMFLQIRQKSGFENFLRADSEAYLLAAAHAGPVVVLNATKLRSDALLVTKANVTTIPLPDLSYSSLVNYCASGTDNMLKEMLEWLWKAAVEVVLRELGYYPNKVDPLPRIWWIGVGLMAKVPIHVAAKFRKGRIWMTTFQYCLPSYTSTIRALQYSRSRQYCQNTSMVIITMPKTPGESPLSGVTEEAEGITQSLRDSSPVEILEMPSAEHVLQVLPRYSIAHFACHGVSQINPADSHLLLLKEHTEQVDKLRVKDIASLKLPGARLAYLSACSTAENKSPQLVDEVTHIASSFHIAGFASVIGTLWPSQDQACQQMAVDFYSALSETDDVAVSYRTAIMRLMKQKPSQPMYWAPFIHFGA